MLLRRCFTKALPDDAQNTVRKTPEKIRKKHPKEQNQKHQSQGKPEALKVALNPLKNPILEAS